MNVWAVVVAAGQGARYGTPKQYLELDGIPLWERSRSALASHPSITDVVVVGDMPGGIPGGERRRDSVYAGLQHIPSDVEWVLVHDGARPLVSSGLLDRLIAAIGVTEADGVIPALAVTDTMKSVDGDRVTATVDRSTLVSVQTPQAFRRAVLAEAHDAFPDMDATDDAGLLERIGAVVVTVPGDPHNMKVTYPGDLEIAAHYLERNSHG